MLLILVEQPLRLDELQRLAWLNRAYSKTHGRRVAD
jgi:hypothetical protein